MFILIAGNFSDGHKVYGPFDSFEDASEWEEVNRNALPFGSWITKVINTDDVCDSYEMGIGIIGNDNI